MYMTGSTRLGQPGTALPKPPAAGTILLTRFRPGSATLRSAHRPLIREVARRVVEFARANGNNLCEGLTVVIEGHEDETGDPAGFVALGLKRVTAVQEQLVKDINAVLKSGAPVTGQATIRVVVTSAGPTRPMRSNVTEDGRSLNRRVEIRVSQANICTAT